MWWFFQYKKFGKLSEYNAITLKGYKSVESEKIPLIRSVVIISITIVKLVMIVILLIVN